MRHKDIAMSQSITQSNKPRAWLLLTFGEQSDYAGHLGYADELSKVYQYDSFVPNCRQITEGDFVLLRDKKNLLGVARIKRIEIRNGEKSRFRCPECKTTHLKKRKTKKPEFHCQKCSYSFDTPILEVTKCQLFTAHFGNSFVPAEGAVSIEELKNSCPNYNGQMAMQLLDLQSIKKTLLENAPEVGQLLVNNSYPDYIEADDADDEESNNDFITYPYHVTTEDHRKIVFRQIRARRGQAQFRKALRERYGDQCMISGCQLLDIIEAAHISPYRGIEDNHPENGLLLRADLHTLFDLDLLGIHPESLKVIFHPVVIAAGYINLENKILLCSKGKPSKAALEFRWTKFRIRGK
jgi:hypothetical protein